MIFSSDPDQAMVRDVARRYISERFPMPPPSALEPAADLDPSILREISDMGWLGLTIPAASGGLGLSLRDAVPILEAAGAGLAPLALAEAIGACEYIVGTCLDGDEVRGFVAGQTHYGLAWLEPGDEPNPFMASATYAYRDGAAVVSGRKLAVNGGAIADYLFVTASSDEGLELVLVDVRSSGVARHIGRAIDGRSVADFTFDNAPAKRLAVGAAAQEIVTHALDRAIVATAAELVGGIEALISLTVRYLKDRHQFGRALAEFQVLRHRVADLTMALEQSQSMLCAALTALEAGASHLVSALKVHVSQAARVAAETAIQVHGGMGMTQEYPAGSYYQRFVAVTADHGGDAYHLDRFQRLSEA